MSTAVGVTLYMSSSSARAGEPVIVAPAVIQGDLNKAIARQLEARLREVVQTSDLEIIEISAAFARRAAACADDTCRATLIAQTSARFLLVSEITLDNEDYHLRLTLYAATGALTARIEDTCELCGLTEATGLMGDLGARIGRKVDVATRAAFFEIRSQPPGAKILIDDKLVGISPLELPIEIGIHELRVEFDEYIDIERELEVAAGESAVLDFELQRLPPKAALDRTKLYVGLGWGALAAGVGAVAGGAAVITLDGRPITSDCSGANVDVDGNCRWRHATLEGGIGLTLGGVVMIGAGVALLVMAAKGQRANSSKTTRLMPAPGGIAWWF
ncbi:PEGA domain-containing protein [Enhygromyxa salina]|uniref:PEGA domain-containing protein n=1 Tax=Enhygromyxa salina TaxID=215803 RepID=UPI0015E6F3C6|nr:PEGA domain-containing protein [Enhygromyxa salina]